MTGAEKYENHHRTFKNYVSVKSAFPLEIVKNILMVMNLNSAR